MSKFVRKVNLSSEIERSKVWETPILELIFENCPPDLKTVHEIRKLATQIMNFERFGEAGSARSNRIDTRPNPQGL